ncbi:NAD(P)-binding domain-containing protein [Cyclobacterium sp. SYSU L10401]|uniref:NAD(P)-binding domain-containing protein n=1 Tax=Cyclobacterium sp. SYSU L10401 TaxID=2678657 RepID=UPI0013D621E7|nr:NAD(P)-binding domain-containing protein [Cyclobacterium sp. SYSU L10401]
MTISIIGLGWLGTPLASELIHQGYRIKGSTTRQDKRELLLAKGIQTFLFELDPEVKGVLPEPLFETDILLINIPPSTRRKPADFHPKQIRQLRNFIIKYQIKKVIYVSATSVYPSENQLATETAALTPAITGNPTLLTAENLLWENKSYDLTVIRFGGLLGDDRIPGRYFSGRENVAGHPPVNYIHRKDAVRAISWILTKNLWNETYNIVCPEHPAKKELFEKNAADFGFDPPSSYENPPKQKWKKISADKWIQTGFTFEFNNPLEFSYTP